MKVTSAIPGKPLVRYWILAAAIGLVVIALLLPPLINLNRYQRRIADAISRGLGRPVHLSSVTLRLLPRPGLEISNFVVEEDPAFGSEPALRAPSVDASIRLTSLWRGRLEVGRISFDQPSVNLVRNADGHWNVGTILLQASHIPNAPTAQRHAGQAPRFPYIEANNARVNFKIGAEKKPFSFLNADFAMWLAQPDEWRIRMEAQPVRTDLDLGLSDTGTMRVEGSLKRASDIGAMPVNLHMEWQNAPLGQVSRLILGVESGWRGNIEVAGDIRGSVFAPQFKTRIHIAGMHRQEFAPLEPFNIDATCQGGYRQPAHSVDGLTCFWPVNDGHLLLTGNIPDIEHPEPALHLHIQNVPATLGLSALRLVRNGFAGATQVSGTMQGDLDYAQRLTGEVNVNRLALRVPNTDNPLLVPALRLVTEQPAPPSRRVRREEPSAALLKSLRLENATIDLGGAAPVTVSGRFTPSAFSFHVSGGASIERLQPVAAGLGLLPGVISTLAAKGKADMDLTVHGPWLPQVNGLDIPISTATTEGTLHLEDTEYRAGFLSGPVAISSAQAVFSPANVTWEPVAAVFQKIPITLSATIPLHCVAPNCVREFSLAADEVDAASLQSALLGAGEHNELLQQLLARLDRNKPLWPALIGTVRVSTFTLGSLAFHDASSQVHIEGRTIQFTSIDGHVLNGVLHASGAMDASGSTPRYSFDTQLTHASAAAASGLWHAERAAGTISLNAHLEMSGYSADALAQSAQGTFHWDWTQGALADAPDQLARFDHWSASGAIKNSQLVLDQSQVTKGAVKNGVSGTISFDRKLNLNISDQIEQAHAVQHAP